MNTSDKVDKQISAIKDWRGVLLAELRKLIHEANPKIEEGLKWGVPVFLANGELVCAISAFKDHVKFNFFQGAMLKEQKNFNSGLDSKKHRSINFMQKDRVDKAILIKLVKEATKLSKLGSN
ncbi:MAG: hypothetical protein JWO40_701 [Candidatus Doudnabacteria bacterium]|nr:hypothetical protein [Candidatus Doudnabacteria bacterium]